MESDRIFQFQDEKGNLVVNIPEKAEAAYGMYTWPCAVVLAQYIWHKRKHLLINKHVLELGAGTALPSVVAAKAGNVASLTLADDTHQPRSIENCRISCAANSIDVCGLKLNFVDRKPCIKVEGLRWGEVNPTFFYGQLKGLLPYPDVILGSDCFFDENIYEKILFTVSHLLEGKMSKIGPHEDKPYFLCTYQVRNANSSIGDLLHLWNLNCAEIDLHSFGGDGHDIASSGMPGNHEIRMLKISLKD
ncbi:histone-arginine methyltransferase METTL23-like [Styela clava]